MPLRLFCVLFSFVALVSTHCVVAQEGKTNTREDTPNNTAVLATILGKTITLNSVMPSEEEREAMRSANKESYESLLAHKLRLAASEQIIRSVLEDYATKNSIEADSGLVEAFERKFSGDYSPNEHTSQSTSLKEIAQREVVKFLVEKAMYEAFGGKVVFTQSNPQMPLDAYKSLLMQYQQNGQLHFTDEPFAQMFWAPFSGPVKFEIPKENIDFSQPWWL